ncbi:hypothetical protein CTAYLR_001027 [Chrysophaeum taylorii]|uniref:Uroporphyrinogen-III synthase n=1 Tax=Chrysophaeum taylorii TaxID=2483200 RepID=A0AAD7XLL9_9STRA|nr:hypothetical protein CTAYLR_001027 [Chrysophaeum taylorii]
MLWLIFIVGAVRGLRNEVVVALTREAGKNDGLRRELEADGLRTVEVPCVAQTRDAAMEAALDAALSSSWSWVVVTSPEAAKTLGDALDRSGCAAPRVATVGEATTSALPGDVFSAFSPSKATAATLGAELPGVPGDRVLYPASKLAAKTLEAALGARGFSVDRVDAYSTVPAEWTEIDRRRAREAHVVAFGSPSAVDVWVARLGTTPRAACIGHTTAAACDAAGFYPQARFPPKPGLKAWAAEISKLADDLAER